MNTIIKVLLPFIILLAINQGCSSQTNSADIVVAAEQSQLYLKYLENKKVGIMVNQTSLVDTIHLLDFLVSENIEVSKIFAAEHGFRGEAANGEEIENSIDHKTKLPVISLYGKNKKPLPEDLQDLDALIFDIQDVGCRFYTYISSMFYLMEACAQNNIEFIVLDRPNPNGDYVAGPVLDMQFKSFVGMIPIPVVHGCTVGELAQMINQEGWLTGGIKCKLRVIPVKNYTHSMQYSLPVKPSPNLPNQIAVRLYPSLCFFEATQVSIGRGTKYPFQVIGFPGGLSSDFSFIPVSIEGMSKNPLHENRECFGIDLRQLEEIPTFTLSFFIQFKNQFQNIDDFWKSKRWIELLSGDPEFYQQINDDWTEMQITESWQAKVNQYKQLRKKYLLYPDFE